MRTREPVRAGKIAGNDEETRKPQGEPVATLLRSQKERERGERYALLFF